jgi:hypothetical protein
MKRLLEGKSDQFERALLRAGRELHPDPTTKRRLLTAMAAGTLAASAGGGASYAATAQWWKTLLATKLGKAMLVGVAVVGSGSVMVALQRPVKQVPSAAANAPLASASSPKVASQPPTPAANQDVAPASLSVPEVNAAEPAPTLVGETPARVRPSKRARHEKSALVVEATGPSAIVWEARLVERLRGAVHAGQAAAVRELLAEYRRSFPAGQLRPEVNKLETQWRAR